MKLKFIRIDANNRVMEIYDVEESTEQLCRDKFCEQMTIKHHKDYVNYFQEFPEETAVNEGDELIDGNFVPFIPPVKPRRKPEVMKDMLPLIVDYIDSKGDASQDLKDLIAEYKS